MAETGKGRLKGEHSSNEWIVLSLAAFDLPKLVTLLHLSKRILLPYEQLIISAQRKMSIIESLILSRSFDVLSVAHFSFSRFSRLLHNKRNTVKSVKGYSNLIKRIVKATENENIRTACGFHSCISIWTIWRRRDSGCNAERSKSTPTANCDQ